MKPVTWIRLFLLCTGIGAAGGMEARDAAGCMPLPEDSLVNPPLMQQADRLLRFDRTLLDIGTLTEDDAPQSYHFTCTNVSGQTLRIGRVGTTCGCTAATVTPNEIPPGGTATVTLTYRPKDHPGTIDASAFVYLTGSDKAPVARLTLRGNVLPGADEWARYPYAMGVLRLKQARMEFRELSAGSRATERIVCGNSGNLPLRLSALLIPTFATFRTEPEVIPPGGEADLVVTVDATLIPAARGDSFEFSVVIDGLDVRPSDRTLKVEVNLRN